VVGQPALDAQVIEVGVDQNSRQSRSQSAV
jgi:hypothetical protein